MGHSLQRPGLPGARQSQQSWPDPLEVGRRWRVDWFGGAGAPNADPAAPATAMTDCAAKRTPGDLAPRLSGSSNRHQTGPDATEGAAPAGRVVSRGELEPDQGAPVRPRPAGRPVPPAKPHPPGSSIPSSASGERSRARRSPELARRQRRAHLNLVVFVARASRRWFHELETASQALRSSPQAAIGGRLQPATSAPGARGRRDAQRRHLRTGGRAFVRDAAWGGGSVVEAGMSDCGTPASRPRSIGAWMMQIAAIGARKVSARPLSATIERSQFGAADF